MKQSEMAKEEYNYWIFTFWFLLAVAVALIVAGVTLDVSQFAWKIACYASSLFIVMGAARSRSFALIFKNREATFQKLESGDGNLPEKLREQYGAYAQKDELFRALQADYERAKIVRLAALNVLEQTIDNQNGQK